MKIINIFFLLILPFTLAKPQHIEVKVDSIGIEKKVDLKVNDSLVDVINKEIERSEKLKDELLNVTKNEMKTEREKNDKLIKILKNR